MAQNGKDKLIRNSKASAEAQQASGAQAAERAARQERNQAERAARKAQRQAERAARKDGKAGIVQGPAMSVQPALQAPVPVAPAPFNILIIAQKGRLAREALLFAASLRRNSPDWRGSLIVAEPLSQAAWAGVDTAIEPQIRAQLIGFGAEIRPFTAQHFGRAYPYGNKIEALAVLPPGQPFVFFDSDTLITGPLDRVAFDFSRPSASMRRSGTWPEPPLYGPGYDEIWGALYARFGLDFASSLDRTQFPGHWQHYLYFNAGWFFGADPQEFGRRFLTWALEVSNAPGEALACQSLNPWLDQVVLPLVVHSLGGGRPGPELDGLDGEVSCHYRNLSLLYARESDAAVALAEELLGDVEISRHLAEDEAFQRLIAAGDGRNLIRPMFEPASRLPEQTIRRQLKQAGLWFR